MGKSAKSKLETILKDKNVTKQTQIIIAQTLAKLGPCGRRIEKKRDAFELWVWRKIVSVSWTERKTNKEILHKVRPKISLEAITKMLTMRPDK